MLDHVSPTLGTAGVPTIGASVLIVDDDRPFLTRLARAMEARGYRVATAETVADGIAAIEACPHDVRAHKSGGAGDQTSCGHVESFE